MYVCVHRQFCKGSEWIRFMIRSWLVTSVFLGERITCHQCLLWRLVLLGAWHLSLVCFKPYGSYHNPLWRYMVSFLLPYFVPVSSFFSQALGKEVFPSSSFHIHTAIPQFLLPNLYCLVVLLPPADLHVHKFFQLHLALSPICYVFHLFNVCWFNWGNWKKVHSLLVWVKLAFRHKHVLALEIP